MTTASIGRRALLAALPGLALAPSALAQEAAMPLHAVETSPEYDAWLDQYGRPTAKVSLNSAGLFDFMVDTGANTTVLSASTAQQIGAKFDGMVELHGTTGTMTLPMAIVDKLVSGVASKSKLRVAVLPDGMLQSHGVLGGDVFAGKKLYFDITRKTVRIEGPERFAMGVMEGGTRLKTVRSMSDITLRNGTLAELQGQVGRVPAKLMIDTGAQSCILNTALSRKLASAYPRMVRMERVKVTGVTGHVMVGEYVELPPVIMGKMTVQGTSGVVLDAPIFGVWGLLNEPAMIVGVDVLSRVERFSVDYGAKRFDVKPMAMMAQQATANT